MFGVIRVLVLKEVPTWGKWPWWTDNWTSDHCRKKKPAVCKQSNEYLIILRASRTVFPQWRVTLYTLKRGVTVKKDKNYLRQILLPVQITRCMYIYTAGYYLWIKNKWVGGNLLLDRMGAFSAILLVFTDCWKWNYKYHTFIRRPY